MNRDHSKHECGVEMQLDAKQNHDSSNMAFLVQRLK
jgi:hypothetical protein